MKYNDFPKLDNNILNQMACEYAGKIHPVQVLENNDDFQRKLTEGILYGISFLELLLRFSKNIFKVRKVRDAINSAIQDLRADLETISADVTIANSFKQGMFRPSCNKFLEFEFEFVNFLLDNLLKEKVADMIKHHINNIKIVSTLLV